MSFKYSPYSFSKLSVAEQCPRKFKYKYIDKIKEEETDRRHLQKGLKIHEALETFDHSQPIENEITKSFVESKLGQKYLNLDTLNNTVRESSIRLIDEDGELKPTSSNTQRKSLLFYGKVDYVGIIDGTLHIVDWKSGKYKDLMYQNFNQLMFYAIYFFLKKHIERISISFVYVEHGLENSILLERKYLNNYISELKQSIERIENSSFEKRASKLCDFCPFQKHCLSD